MNHDDLARVPRGSRGLRRLPVKRAEFARNLERQLLGLRLWAHARAFSRSIKVLPRSDLVELGSRGYGFWVVPATLLGPDSHCYLAGVGEDITFDLALIARFGCTAHAFDPVPAAQHHAVVSAQYEPRFVFHPVGLWSSDATLPLHAPAVEGHVSHSAIDLHATPKLFDAQFRSVASLMQELGHDRLDLLKVSAEGSEYEILRGMAAANVRPRVVCVEFAQPAPRGRPAGECELMRRRGYDLVHATVTPWTLKVTFVSRTHEEQAERPSYATDVV